MSLVAYSAGAFPSRVCPAVVVPLVKGYGSVTVAFTVRSFS